MKRTWCYLAALGLPAAALLLAPDTLTERVGDVIRDAAVPVTSPLARLANARARAPDPRVLQEEVVRLRLEVRRLAALDQENQHLRRMLGLRPPDGWTLIAAELLVRDLNAWRQEARLDKGAAAGVRPGMPAITPEGLLGRVVGVSRLTSDVVFLPDARFRVSARLPRTGAFGIVRGQGVSWRGQAACLMDYLPAAAAILPGDDVVTSGLGGGYPPGLLVGRVRRVRLDRSGLYQTAEIAPAADVRNSRALFLMDRAPDATEDSLP